MKQNGQRSQLTIALAGNPNAGKTTLLIHLPALSRKLSRRNRRTHGTWKLERGHTNLIDLPGLYSLDATSLDEQIARDDHRKAGGRPQA
jgi:ferrous iron transport protein B